MSEVFDVAVIGSGPGGYVAAIRAAQRGAKVACIEKGPLGGTCLNRGCIPTKALLEASHLVAMAREAAQFGVNLGTPTIDFPKMLARKDAVVARLGRGIEQLFKKNKVAHVAGTARFARADELEVVASTGEKTLVRAKKVIIATGSEPLDMRAFACDGDRILSSTDILSLKTLPASLLILGGGYIGCEFACLFAELGAKVFVVEMLDRILPLGDADVSKEITAALRRLKVKVHAGTKLEALERNDTGVVGRLSDGTTIEAECALISIGRKLNSDGLALDAAGVKVGDRGAIPVNDHCQTNVPTVYAIGDVTGMAALAHTASRMGIVAAEHAAGGLAKMDYRVVPACIFTHPEAASVGISEADAAQRGIEVKTFKFPVPVLGKAQAVGETGGFIKIIAQAKTGQVLGVHIVCSRAGDIIGEAALAIRLEATAEELARTIHVHPTLSEGMMEAAEGWLGHGIHYP